MILGLGLRDRQRNVVETSTSHGTKTAQSIIKILMIDDDPHYCKFIREILQSKGNLRFLVSSVDSLEEAKLFLEDETPNVILLDLSLKNSKGMDTLHLCRALTSTSPIIVLTGSESESLGLTAVASGAQDYLVKQLIGKDSIVRCIRYTIERYKAEEQRLRMAAIQDFTSMLAHDLKVPILGTEKVLDALLSKQLGELTQTQMQVLSSIRDANQRQLKLIRKLLEIYQYEVGRADLILKELNTETLITDCVEPITSNLDIKIETNFASAKNVDGSPCIIKGDRESLIQLLSNLLDNAIKYGDISKPIAVSSEIKNDKFCTHIHNFGNVISPDIQQSLFKSFWQGIPGKTYVANTGLGLYLCHRIAQLHGGSLNCHSTAEAGTTMTLKLPLKK